MFGIERKRERKRERKTCAVQKGPERAIRSRLNERLTTTVCGFQSGARSAFRCAIREQERTNKFPKSQYRAIYFECFNSNVSVKRKNISAKFPAGTVHAVWNFFQAAPRFENSLSLTPTYIFICRVIYRKQKCPPYVFKCKYM